MTELLAFIIGICAGVGIAYGYYRYRIFRQELDALHTERVLLQVRDMDDRMRNQPGVREHLEMKERNEK